MEKKEYSNVLELDIGDGLPSDQTPYVKKIDDIEANMKECCNSVKARLDNIETATNAIIYGWIEFLGEDTKGTLGGDFAGLSKEQLQGVYPFRRMYVEDVTAYAKDKVTKLSGKDRFLVMPNYYVRVQSKADGYLKIEVSNIKYADGFHKVYDATGVTWLHLAVYKADYDSTGTSVFGYLRSRSGMRPVADDTDSKANTDMASSTWNQANAILHMPYYNVGTDCPVGTGGFRRAEYQDYRIRGAYDWLAVIYGGTRQMQSLYYGMAGYSWNDGKRDIIPKPLQFNGSTDSFGTGPFSEGKVESYTAEGAPEPTTVGNTQAPFRFMGLENPWGYLWENVYGIGHNSGNVVAYKGSAELDSAQINPSSSSFVQIGFNLPTTSEGWQKRIGDANGLPAPVSLGSSEGKSVGDYYWYNSGYQIVFLGGFWAGWGNGGLVYFNAYYGFGLASVNYGFRLSYVS